MRLPSFGHPSMRKLQRWVEGEPDDKLDVHLATCTRCAARLEPMLDESAGDLRPALIELLEVPDELPERLRESIDMRMQGRADLALITEFFGLPIRTVRLISTTSQGDN